MILSIILNSKILKETVDDRLFMKDLNIIRQCRLFDDKIAIAKYYIWKGIILKKVEKKTSLVIPATNKASQWVQSLAIFKSPFLKKWKYVSSCITLEKF